MKYPRPISIWLRLGLGAIALALVLILFAVRKAGSIPIKENREISRISEPAAYYVAVAVIIAQIALVGFLATCPNKNQK